MCSSMIGFLKIFKASLIATEVWVKAAALIIIPSNLFLASWIMFTRSPSTFDWNISVSRFNSSDFFLQISFNFSKVIYPYCDCSLSPNRLRFGPLIIIILLFIKLLYTMKKIKKIKIKVNGKLRLINKDSSALNVIKNLKIPLKKVAIELNQEIVDKKKLNKINLKNNDKIEIVHFIGGG